VFQDQDNDGVCDAQDTCPNFNNNNVGSACNDGNVCTVNDTFFIDSSGNCGCAGTYVDSDNDGTCDAQDLCTGPEPGSACDDGDLCTINDTVDGGCNCTGTFLDTDNDGTCDANDLCAGPEPGSPCGFNGVVDNNCNCDASCTLEIPMAQGWNLISSYCMPVMPNMEDVFVNIAGNTIQVKNITDTYVPSFNLNDIGNWDITSGYQVKMLVADTLVINGTWVDPLTTPINLGMGWNLISYLLPTPSDPVDILVDVIPNIIQVKNITGTFNPSFNNFNTMGDMLPTQGYQIKMSAADILIYDPANQ